MGAATFLSPTHFDKNNQTSCLFQDDGTTVAAGEALFPCDTVWTLLTSLVHAQIELQSYLAPAVAVDEAAIFMPQTVTII